MNMTGNTILITGGGSGIGRGLAEAFHAAGNHVIVAGRRAELLQEVVAANPGITAAVLDVADPKAIEAFAARVAQEHPALNVLINNAGIMKFENPLAEPFNLADAEATVAINLLGPIRLSAALLAQLRRQAAAAIINVTSGLAFVPLAASPTYSATKAAMHSYSQSLRYLLRETAVQVIELPPPMVATELTPRASGNPHAMPLEDYVKESMALLAGGETTEILVERVKPTRFAEAKGEHEKAFAMLNNL